MPNNIEKSTNLLNESDKEFINAQTRLHVSKLNVEITTKLRHANEVSMKHPKVSEILQLENFSKYPLLQKALSWRYALVDNQNWSDQQKQFYKQVLLAKAMLSVSLRNMGELDLAKEIDFSVINAQNFQKAAQNNTLQSHIFSGSYLKCLHAFQKVTQKDEGTTISKRSKVDAILGYRTVQQLLSYAHYTVSKPVVIEQEFKREYVTGKIDYSNPTIVQNSIDSLIKTSLLGSINQITGNKILNWVRNHPELTKDVNINDQSSIDTIITSMTAKYCIEFISLSDSQYILQSLNKYAANTNGEIVDTIINPYRKELIDHMLKLGASQSNLGVIQNINNIKSTIDSSIDMKEFEKIGNQYRQDHLKNKSEQHNGQKNPYLTSPFNPRNYINPELTKRGDQLFHEGMNIDEKMEKYLYGQKRGDPLFGQGITYTVMKDGILNMPDDILMFVGDIAALGAAAVSGQGLLFKYLGARRNADSNPQAAQDLAWMIEAHPMLGLLNLLSRQTIKGLGSQMWTIMQGKGTAKEIGDFINMVGGLVVGAGGVVKVGGKMIQFGSKLAKSERVSRVAQTISKAGSRVADIGSKIDPANIALSGAGAVVGATADAMRGSKVEKIKTLSESAIKKKLGLLEEELKTIQQDNHPRIAEIDAEMTALEKSLKDKSSQPKTKKPKEKLPEKLKPITSESELVDAQKSLNQEIIRGALSAEEIGRRLGYLMAQFHDLLKSGVIKSREVLTQTYLWVRKQYMALTDSLKSKYGKQMDDLDGVMSKELETTISKSLSISDKDALLAIKLHDLNDSRKAVETVVRLGKITDSWRGFEGLLTQLPNWVVKQIPGINLLPIEAGTNLIYALIHYKYARKIGMSAEQIKVMMMNQAKDSGISLISSGVRAVTGGGILGGFSPLNRILSAGFGIGDLAYKANRRNAQEFVKFYGQQIEELRHMGAPIEQIKLHQQKFDKLSQELHVQLRNYDSMYETAKVLSGAKNINEIKSIIMQKLPDKLNFSDMPGVTISKKLLLQRIDDCVSGKIEVEFLTNDYNIRSTVQKILQSKKANKIVSV